jgi:hypothetical protein
MSEPAGYDPATGEIRSAESFNDNAEFTPVALAPAATVPYLFEGTEVAASSAKLASKNNLDIGDRVLSYGDYAELTIIVRVAGVDHSPAPENEDILGRGHRLVVADTTFVRAWSPRSGVEYR